MSIRLGQKKSTHNRRLGKSKINLQRTNTRNTCHDRTRMRHEPLFTRHLRGQLKPTSVGTLCTGSMGNLKGTNQFGGSYFDRGPHCDMGVPQMRVVFSVFLSSFLTGSPKKKATKLTKNGFFFLSVFLFSHKHMPQETSKSAPGQWQRPGT